MHLALPPWLAADVSTKGWGRPPCGLARTSPPGSRWVFAILNPLAALCISQGLPPLWTLVVAASSGLGSGYWREHDDSHKAARQNECFAYYGVARRPEGLVREVCPDCFTEKTPAGTCLC